MPASTRAVDGASTRPPFEACRRFQKCSCNVCPLDPDVERMFALPGEMECRADRPTREKIAASYLGRLPWNGLLPGERARDHRKAEWAALPEDDPRKVRLRSARAKAMAQKAA
jgi:hypothetical protein